jgi:hypothetical protein
LFDGCFDWKAYSSLHTKTIPYATRFCNIQQRLCRGKGLSG